MRVDPELLELLSLSASVATTVGVIVGASQLLHWVQKSASAFEDGFAKEYRALVANIPTKAFFGEDLSEEEFERSLDEFYHYFDLCNEQAFQYEQGRVRRKTWRFWKEGMQENLRLPTFQRAWRHIAQRIAEHSLSAFKRQLRGALK